MGVILNCWMLLDVTMLGRGVVADALQGLCALRTTIISSGTDTAAVIPPTAASDDLLPHEWQRFGVALYSWDLFCAFSVVAVIKVGAFDGGVVWGKLDYDYYRSDRSYAKAMIDGCVREYDGCFEIQ